MCWLEGGTVSANGCTHYKQVYLSERNYIWGGTLTSSVSSRGR